MGLLDHVALGTERNPGPGPKSGKHKFLVQGVAKRKKKVTTVSGIFFFYISCFGQPDPQGREITKYGDFRPFWPRTAFGTYRNPERGLKTEKTQFPGARGPETEKKVTSLSGMVVHNFFMFCPTGPPRAGNRKIRAF